MSPENIKELRRRRCWTYQELADSVYSSQLSAIRWEVGIAKPRPAVARRLRELLENARKRDASNEWQSRRSRR